MRASGARRFGRIGALFLVGLLAACAAPPEQACGVQAVGSVPIEMQGGEPIVVLTVGGVPLRMVLDSGAQLTAVTAEAAERAHLPIDYHLAPLVGIGGRSERHYFSFANAKLADISVAPFLGAVGVFGSSSLGGHPFDGFLGVDVLGRYDIDLDLPRRRAVFYTGKLCDASAIPWNVPARSLEAYARAPDYDPRLYLSVVVNGTPLNALLDTGAVRTVISGDAFRLIPPPHQEVSTPRPIHLVGFGGAVVTARMERFATLVVGGATSPTPEIPVLEDMGTQMLLGTDYSGRYRMWLSFSSGRAFVDRAGPP